MTDQYLGRFVGGPHDGRTMAMTIQPSGALQQEVRFPVPPPPIGVDPPSAVDEDLLLRVDVYRWRGAGVRRKWDFMRGDSEPQREWVYREATYVWSHTF